MTITDDSPRSKARPRSSSTRRKKHFYWTKDGLAAREMGLGEIRTICGSTWISLPAKHHGMNSGNVNYRRDCKRCIAVLEAQEAREERIRAKIAKLNDELRLLP